MEESSESNSDIEYVELHKCKLKRKKKVKLDVKPLDQLPASTPGQVTVDLTHLQSFIQYIQSVHVILIHN